MILNQPIEIKGVGKHMLRNWAYALALVALPASAQVAPISKTVTLTFSGVVANNVADTIKILQPNGSFVPYSGPVPTFPYEQGQPVSISFNATLPTKAFYDSGTYKGQIAADGIYRITVNSPMYNGGGGPGGIGNATTPTVSGNAIAPVLNSGQPTNERMTIVYDYNNDTYSLEGSGGFNSAYFGFMGPGLVYDASNGTIVSCATPSACGIANDRTNFAMSGNADGTQVNTSNIGFVDSVTGLFAGLFSLSFSGSWNLPQSTGGATQVPEPGTLGLFGAASAMLALRRRKAKRSAAAR